MAYLANRSVTQRNTAVVASTLTGSTITTSGITASTLTGSTMTTSALGFSTLTGSTLTASGITTSNLTGSTLQTQTLSLQSTMIGLGPNTQSTFVNASQGSYAAGSWNNTTSALTLSNIRTLGMSSTGQYQLVIQDGNGTVYLSSTSGQTWSALGSANGLPTGSPAYKSAAISADGSIILVAIEGDYLYRSTDSGVTFSAINTSSPQIYLPLDGNTTDVAGGSSPAVTGSVSYVPGPVTGQAVSLVNTAGSAPNNYIRGSYSLGSNFTLSCWFNMQSYPANTQIATILSVGGNPAGSVHIYYLNNNAGRTGLYSEAYILNGPAVITAGFAPTIQLNTWYHVYVIYQSAGVYSLYLNGSLMGSISGQTLFNNPTGYGIGTYSQFAGTADAFNGYIDDVRLMNSAVTNFPLVKSLWSKVALSGSGVYALAGNTFGRVFSSSNGGSTWTHQSTAQAAGSISDIELSTTGQYQAIVSQKIVTPNQSGLAASTWTQNGVNWTASASSVYLSYSVDKAFNNNPTSTWASNSSTYNGSGTYAGAVSTTIQGGVGPISGEWLQLQSSTPLILYSYTYGVGTPANQLPKSYYIVGSNDGSTWYPLQYVSMTTSPFTTTLAKCSTNLLVNYTGTQTIQGNQTGSGSTTAYPTSTSSYLYFRLIFVTTYGGGVVELSEFYPNFLADNTFSPQQTGLTTSIWQTLGVTWTVSSSSIYGAGSENYRAFDNLSNRWTSVDGGYNTSTGLYTANTYSTTIQTIGAVPGEWLQLRVSTPLVLQSYTYSMGVYQWTPKTYYIIGSNDGSTWYPLQYVTMTTNPFNANDGSASTYIIMNYTGTQTIQGQVTGSGTTTAYSNYVTQAFTYFRIVITSQYGGSGSSTELGEFRPIFLGGQNYSTNYGSTWSPALSYGDAFNVTKNTIVTSGGVSGVVQLPPFRPLTTGVTFSAWFVLNEAPVQYSRIFDLGDNFRNPSPSNSLHTYFNTNRTITNGITTNSISVVLTSSTACIVGTLYHFVWTIIGTNQHALYINGVQEATSTQPIPIVNYSSFFLGFSNWPDGQSAISIRDFRMFNRGLMAAEVAALYANQNYGMPSLPLLSVSGNGKYAIGAKDQNLYVDANYLSGFGGSSYTNPTLTGINATISDVAVSHTGQYMVFVTAGTTNNVYYSVDYGSTFTSLTIGSAPLFNCDMSADGSRMSVSSLAITYTLNRNSTGFSIALGSQAGRVSQATNAIAIGNQAATWNQSANSIVVNATGSQVSTLGSGLYVAPIADAGSSASASLSLLGYGTDQQVVQTGITVSPGGVFSSVYSSGVINATGVLSLINASSDMTGVIRMTTSGGINFIQSAREYVGSSAADLAFTGMYGGPEWMRITSNGRVGIGLTNPFSALTIVNGESIYIGNSTSSALRIHHNTSNQSFLDFGNGNLFIRTSTGIATEVNRIVITSGGNVGIGTTNPSAPLTVNGNIYQNIVDNTVFTIDAANLGRLGFFKQGGTFPKIVASSTSPITFSHLSSGDLTTASSSSTVNDRVIIDSSGNVGIGTTTPTNKLHVIGDGDALAITTFSPGYNNTFPETSILFKANVTGDNFSLARIKAKDTSNGASTYRSILTFETNSISAGPLTERMRINEQGNVGIGTDNPGSYKLYVQGDIYASGNITGLSDRRFKTQLEPLMGALDRLSAVNGYTYFRPDHRPDERQMGLIAQEVQEVYPEAVTYDKDNDRYGVNYGAMIAPLVQAMKEMRSEYSTMIGQLKEEISSLKAGRLM